MLRIGLALIALAFAAALSAGPAAAQNPFDWNPGPTYASVSSDVTTYQFHVNIRSPWLPDDELFVEISSPEDQTYPPTWFAQFCQESNGVCYFESAPITLPGTDWDRLLVDFFVPPGDVNKGWVNLRVYRINDPGTFQEVTFALGHGVTLPAANFVLRASQVFQQANPNDTVEFTANLQSFEAFDDSVMVSMRKDLPQGWFSQFCQVSTGICYFGDATIEMPAFSLDQLRVDFFCFSPDPAIGNVRLKVQSVENPAVWRAIPFRVRTGSIPSDAAESQAAPLHLSIGPNPIRTTADLRIDLARPSSVELRVVDLGGREVSGLTTPLLGSGSHELSWDGLDAEGRLLPNGIYFYRLAAGGEEVRGKMILNRD